MTEIPNALTPEEWKERREAPVYCGAPFVELSDEDTREGHRIGRLPCIGPDDEEFQLWADGTLTYYNEYVVEQRHALAALALHGQPFGFSHEDVRMLRSEAGQCEAAARWSESGNGTDRPLSVIDAMNARNRRDAAERWISLASRIAALLPPEEPTR